MTTVTGVTAFLLARLGEDEAAAKAGRFYRSTIRPSRGRWHAYLEGGSDGYAIEDTEGNGGFIVGQEGPAQHIARHDPARVLREVEAKRRIIALHSGDHECVYLSPSGERYTDHGGSCTTVYLLTMSNSDNPDYDPDWRRP